jgi:hypothetical protein
VYVECLAVELVAVDAAPYRRTGREMGQAGLLAGLACCGRLHGLAGLDAAADWVPALGLGLRVFGVDEEYAVVDVQQDQLHR